jgi:hypothetical protein
VGGRKCDPRDKVCTSTPHTGSAIGADCEQWALTDGGVGAQCAGICLHTIAQQDAGQTDPLNQVYFCSELCVFGDIFGPACGYKETVPKAVCIYATSEAGNGDYGFCAQRNLHHRPLRLRPAVQPRRAGLRVPEPEMFQRVGVPVDHRTPPARPLQRRPRVRAGTATSDACVRGRGPRTDARIPSDPKPKPPATPAPPATPG